jgi:replication-associated recombination protein RarA
MTTDFNGDRSNWKHPRPSLSEILRPEALTDLTLPMPTIERLQRGIETGSMVNMLFYGPPGSGKTSAAKIFINAIGDCLAINRASKTSPNLSKYIQNVVGRVGWNMCFVDEAHLISKPEQIALPNTMEWLSDNRHFIFAATDIMKLIPTLRSRLMEISFEVAQKDREEVQKRLMKRYENILPANGFEFDQVRIKQIIDAHFPDLRAIANNIEFECG